MAKQRRLSSPLQSASASHSASLRLWPTASVKLHSPTSRGTAGVSLHEGCLDPSAAFGLGVVLPTLFCAHLRLSAVSRHHAGSSWSGSPWLDEHSPPHAPLQTSHGGMLVICDPRNYHAGILPCRLGLLKLAGVGHLIIWRSSRSRSISHGIPSLKGLFSSSRTIRLVLTRPSSSSGPSGKSLHCFANTLQPSSHLRSPVHQHTGTRIFHISSMGRYLR